MSVTHIHIDTDARLTRINGAKFVRNIAGIDGGAIFLSDIAGDIEDIERRVRFRGNLPNNIGRVEDVCRTFEFESEADGEDA